MLGLLQGRFARPLAVGTSLMFFQQVTGQPSVLYYASEIFEDAGFAAGAEANGISVILGVFKLIMTGARPCQGCTPASPGAHAGDLYFTTPGELCACGKSSS